MSDTMVVEAILRDGVSPALKRIASEQDAYARRTNAINIGSNVFLGIGAAAVAFTVRSIKVAGQLDAIRRSMAQLTSQQQASSDMSYINQFARSSAQTYMDLADAGRKLDQVHISITDHLKEMADVATATGKPISEVAKLYFAIGAGNLQLAIGARGMSRFGISTKEIFAAAGMHWSPGQKIQGSMTTEQALAAVGKAIESKYGDIDQKNATTTLSGASNMVKDSLTRLQASVGQVNLAPTITLLNRLAGSINNVADAAANHPRIVLGAEIAGVGALAIGGIVKGIATYRSLKGVIKDVTDVSKIERAGEVAKGGIAEIEAAKVGKTVLAFQGAKTASQALSTVSTPLERLMGKLSGKFNFVARAAGEIGPKVTGVAEACGLAADGGIAAATAGLGLMAIAAAGLVGDLYLLLHPLSMLNDASRNQEAAAKAIVAARKEGYDIGPNAGKAIGYSRRSVLSQWGHDALEAYGLAGEEHPEFGAITPPGWNKQHHAMAKNGIRAHQLQAAAKAAHLQRKAANDEAGDMANKYEIPAELDYKIQHYTREIDLLNAQGASQAKINALKVKEIALHKEAARLLLGEAQIASDPKDRYRLLNQSEEQNTEAARLAIKDKSDKKSATDRLTTKILGGADESDLVKHGLNRRFFASIHSGKLPMDPIKAALLQLKKKPIELHLHIGDKVVQTLKTEVEDDVVKQLIAAMSTSSSRTLLGAH